MLKYLLIFIPSLCFGAYPALELMLDMEVGSPDGTVVTTNTCNQRQRTNIAGLWTTYPIDTLTKLTVSTDQGSPFRGPITVAGTEYNVSTGFRSYRMNNLVDREQVRFTLTAITNKVSVAVAMKFVNSTAAWKTTFGFFDTFALEGTNGEFLVLSLEDRDTPWRFQLHTSAGVSASTTQMDTNIWYWVCALWDSANSIAKMQVFNMTNWNLVMSTNLALAANENCNKICLGRFDDHNVFLDANYFIDNLMLDVGSDAIFPILPPGATIVATGVTRAAFDQAYTNASPNSDRAFQDTILLPTGSNDWASGYNIDKALTISGSGSNWNQTVLQFTDTVGQKQLPIFDLRADYCSVSNIQLRSGDVTASWLVICRSNMCRMRNVFFTKCLSPVISYRGGLMYDCVSYNAAKLFRAFAEDSNQRYIELGSPWHPSQILSNTNCFIAENCIMVNDANSTIQFPAVVTSQASGFWCVRHCVIKNTKSFGPAFDAHGGGFGTHGVVACQVYSNYIESVNGDSDKFIDARGTIFMVFSNYCTATWDRGIFMRRDDGDAASYFDPGQQITNSIYYYNFDNNGIREMQTDIEANDTSVIITNRSYTGQRGYMTYTVQYPHFLREGVTHDPTLSGAFYNYDLFRPFDGNPTGKTKSMRAIGVK